jgi:hypothetical protein
MSKHKITVLQCVPGHCDITGNKKADILAKKVPFYHTNHRQGVIRLYCQSRNQKELQEDERLQTGNKNIAETLEIFNCKHAWLTKEWGRWKLSSTFWIWLPCETFVSHRIISPSFLHILWSKRRDGPAPFVETHCFIFKVWEPNIIGDKRSSRWTTLSTQPLLKQINILRPSVPRSKHTPSQL